MAAVFLVVVVGAFVGYLATQSTVQQVTSASDFNSARALQAARAGIEWGSYKILRNSGSTCADATTTLNHSTTTLDFAGTSLATFSTTVSCTSTTLTECAANVTVYQLTATACNVTNATAPYCPNSSAAPGTAYVERRMTATIAR